MPFNSSPGHLGTLMRMSTRFAPDHRHLTLFASRPRRGYLFTTPQKRVVRRVFVISPLTLHNRSSRPVSSRLDPHQRLVTATGLETCAVGAPAAHKLPASEFEIWKPRSRSQGGVAHGQGMAMWLASQVARTSRVEHHTGRRRWRSHKDS